MHENQRTVDIYKYTEHIDPNLLSNRSDANEY